jgi:hypothetical protein
VRLLSVLRGGRALREDAEGWAHLHDVPRFQAGHAVLDHDEWAAHSPGIRGDVEGAERLVHVGRGELSDVPGAAQPPQLLDESMGAAVDTDDETVEEDGVALDHLLPAEKGGVLNAEVVGQHGQHLPLTK